MTLPASGPISISQVNVELGYAAATPDNLGSSAIRSLAGNGGGPVSMSVLYGKASSTNTLVAGSSGNTISVGYIPYTTFTAGSLTPPTFNGVTIQQFYTYTFTSSLYLTVQVPNQPDFFTSLTIDGTTYLMSNAKKSSPNSASTGWEWPYTRPFVTGNTYPINVT